MDKVNECLESELNRTLERIRRMGSDIAVEQSSAALGEEGTLYDELDAWCLSADREMSLRRFTGTASTRSGASRLNGHKRESSC